MIKACSFSRMQKRASRERHVSAMWPLRAYEHSPYAVATFSSLRGATKERRGNPRLCAVRAF
jgi:hypothetical protein